MDADEDHAMEVTGSETEDRLVSEFQSWRVENPNHVLNLGLDRIEKDTDGTDSLRLHLRIDSETFTLRCPPSYPDYDTTQDNFFVEAPSCLQLWGNALNEFLLDSQDQLNLISILSKGCSLYSSKDRTEMMDFDENSDREEDDEYGEEEEDEEEEEEIGPEDYHLDDMLDKDLNWELEVAKRKKKWKAREDELRAEKAEKLESSSSSLYGAGADTTKGRQPKQIFSSLAASGVLTNDLVDIMETVKETGIVADTLDDNIFQWNVKMSKFGRDSHLDRDCQELALKFGYDYIELQLDFSMDLYPFYPPLVKVIRPRLQGSMMLRVTTMEILKLNGWDFAKNMKSVLSDIKDFLAKTARLNINSERNNRDKYPDGAYIDIEHHLLRLALVSEVDPRANKKYSPLETPQEVPRPSSVLISPKEERVTPSQLPDSSDDEDEYRLAQTEPSSDEEDIPPISPPNEMGIPEFNGPQVASSSFSVKTKSLLCVPKLFQKKHSEEKGKAKKGMAKGTGYSNYSEKGWDLKAFMAAQRENDRQIQIVLAKILVELQKLHTMTAVKTRNLPDLLFEAAASSSGSTLAPVETVETEEEEEEEERGCKRKRKHSPGAESPVDSRSDLYAVLEGSALVPFLESKLQSSSFLEISRHASVYKVIIGILREMCEQNCLVSLLGPLPNQAQSLSSLLQTLETQARIANEKIGKASANGSVPSKKSEEGEKDDGQMAKDFLLLSKEVTEALKLAGYLPDVNGSTRTETPSPECPVAGPSGVGLAETESEEERYRRALSPLQYEGIEFASHTFLNEVDATSLTSKSIYRIANEVATISRAECLPSSISSSIFVRSDDSKIPLLKAIITGPSDTPYTGGVYEFDILFPVKAPGYPSVPPKVKFRTTGAGSVRFNPNLYNDGKVCLSLLGTWDGAPGEQWSPDNSTIIQVLISIQSLILVPEPYYNEPGYDKNYGTSSGNRESLQYNENVFKNNLRHAILEQLKSPPEGFSNVVRSHFFYKRESLIKELEKTAGQYSNKDNISKLLTEVKTELMKIKIPSQQS